MVLIFTFILASLAAILALLAHRRGVFKQGLRAGTIEFIYLIPRVAIGVIGSGFIAALLPKAFIESYLSNSSGVMAYLLATIFGIFTPGGPVVGFALAVGSLKAGASLPVIMAYVTAWSLMAVQRIVMWELPVIPKHLAIIRFLASLPLPFMAGALFYLLKPAFFP